MPERLLENTVVDKRNPPFIYCFLFFIIYSIFFLKLYEFRKNKDLSVNTDVKTSYINNGNDELEDIINTIKIRESGQKNLTKAELGIAHFFLKREDGRISNILANDFELKDREILLRLHNIEGGDLYYEVLDSKDVSFNLKHGVGDIIKINSEISVDRLFMRVFADDFALERVEPAVDFKLSNDLKIGDRIIFICEKPGCDDFAVVWMLVIF